jgi:hypothetical protein
MTKKNKKYSNVPLEVELKLKKILIQDLEKSPLEEKKYRDDEREKARKRALERYKGKLTTEEMFSRGLFK